MTYNRLIIRTAKGSDPLDVTGSQDLCMLQTRAHVGDVHAFECGLESVKHYAIGTVADCVNVLPLSQLQNPRRGAKGRLTTCHPSRKNRGTTSSRVSLLTRMTPWL
jgi:hypothetical protein